MALQKAAALLPALRQAVMTGSDFAAAKAQLAELKILATEFPSAASTDATAVPSAEEAAISRDILELGVLLSVRSADWRAFERNIGQLQQYYSEAALASQSESSSAADTRRHVTGLQLMHLLVAARLADFHCRVESLSAADLASAYISFPLTIDQLLAGGGYNKVLAARNSMPSPLYAPLMDNLLGTVQDDIADCASVAYEHMSVAEACKMLRLEGGAAALSSYAARRELHWTVEGSTVRFAPVEKHKPEVDAEALVATTLTYANELERIV